MEHLKKQPRDKYELRDYLYELDLKNPDLLEEKAEEIMCNVLEVMERYIALPTNHPLRNYYEPCLLQIKIAYAAKDFKKEFPLAISNLLNSINWE